MRNAMSTNAGIAAEIAKGWKPNQYLTNMSQAYFTQPGDFVAPAISLFAPCRQVPGFITHLTRQIWPEIT